MTLRSLISRGISPRSGGTQAGRLPLPVTSLTSILSGITGQGLVFSPANVLNGMSAYVSVGWVFAAVSRTAESVAQTEWQLYKGPGVTRTEVHEHPSIDLWHKPNPFETREEFVETLCQNFLLAGEIWIHVLRNAFGEPAELWAIRPDLIYPVPDREKHIIGYVYKSGRESIPIPLEDIIFYKRNNPLDPLRGAGVMTSILSDIEGERAASLWNRNFFYNSAEPGGIIEVTKKITPEEFQDMVVKWREQHQGIANAHRVAILTQGTWKDRKLSQRDMQFHNLRQMNRDTILGAFGFPLPILGIVEHVNRANAEAAEVMFSRWVISPILHRIRGILNEKILPMYGDVGSNADLQFDFPDPVPAHRELNLQIAVQGWLSQLLTKNEGRRFLGLGDDPGGDIFIPEPSGHLTPGGGGQATGTSISEPVRRINIRQPVKVKCPECKSRGYDKLLPIQSVAGEAQVYCRFCHNGWIVNEDGELVDESDYDESESEKELVLQ